MSRGDGRALEAAARDAARELLNVTGNRGRITIETATPWAEKVVAAYIDALLSELPGELHSKAFTAAENAHWKEHKRLGFVNSGRLAETAIRAFLLSLRSSSRGANG